MGEESPYGPIEPIYGGSIAGTPRRARPSIPPPAPPAPLQAETPPHHTPTRSEIFFSFCDNSREALVMTQCLALYYQSS